MRNLCQCPWSLALVGLALTLPARAADVDRFVPGDAEQVVAINVKQILASPLIKKHALPEIEKQLKENKDLKQLQQLTGLDPLKDVHTLVVATCGSNTDKVMVIVRGQFDTKKIHQVAEAIAKDKKDELKISKLGDRPLYEGKRDGNSFFFTFFDGTTMIGSTSKSQLTTAVEGKGGKVSRAVAAALEGVDSKQSIWAAGLAPEEVLKNVPKADPIPTEAVKKIKTFSTGLTVTKDVAATFRVSTGDEKAAKELSEFATQVKGLIAFAAQMNEMIAPFANEFLKTLDIQTSKGDVGISFKFSEEIAEKAMKLIPKK